MLNRLHLFLVAAVAVRANPVAPLAIDTFMGVSLRSGDANVHLREINANGNRFYVNKDSSAYCPPDISGLDCSEYGNNTVFAYNSEVQTLGLATTLPGGQQIYVAADGALSYTVPHSAAIPADALVRNFTYTPGPSENEVGNLKFQDAGFSACPTSEMPIFQIFATNIAGYTRTDCTGINFGTTGSQPSAYQY